MASAHLPERVSASPRRFQQPPWTVRSGERWRILFAPAPGGEWPWATPPVRLSPPRISSVAYSRELQHPRRPLDLALGFFSRTYVAFSPEAPSAPGRHADVFLWGRRRCPTPRPVPGRILCRLCRTCPQRARSRPRPDSTPPPLLTLSFTSFGSAPLRPLSQCRGHLLPTFAPTTPQMS